LSIFENSRKLRPSFKLNLSFLLLYSTSSTFLLHLCSTNYFFKIVIVTVVRASNIKKYFSTNLKLIRIHHSRLINIVSSFFLFGLLIFAVKLNTLTVEFIVHTVQTKMLLINVYHGSQILHFNQYGLRYSFRVHIFCSGCVKSLSVLVKLLLSHI
jgi:hypothetical protein